MGHRRSRLAPIAGLTLWLIVAVLFRKELEASMLSHSLVQLPLLAVSGALLIIRRGPAATSPMALPALLLAIFASAVWMLPRMLDASLSSREVEVAKLVTIPLLIGFPLGWCWPRLGGLIRAFVWANLVSMFLTLGWLYKAAPVRVCNYYLLGEQQQVGTAYLVLVAAIVLRLLPTVFLGAGAGPLQAGREPAGSAGVSARG